VIDLVLMASLGSVGAMAGAVGIALLGSSASSPCAWSGIETPETPEPT
jgi:hypothetical protein